ncbi:MAG: aldehyde dehydrogenase family protein, partial [Myxococcales bacterium]|nr:aldehyde dehydrogenase family protein [Myxococcales bacterium]
MGLDGTIASQVSELRKTFESGKTRPLAWRRAQLRALEAMLTERESELLEALRADMRKPRFEAWGAEIRYVANESKMARDMLDEWAAPEPVATNFVNQPGKSRIHKDPLGVVLIIGPWNYPIQLVLAPLIGAIAAGNCAVIKPSEVSVHASAALAKWLPKYLDTTAFRIVEGGVPETTALLAEPFDHIFYTGNGTVGRIVMEAAAKHLTPVTLELGGKSPTIIDEHVDLDVAVRRTLWGKFFNVGQTCTAPDYVLVHERVEEAFVNACKEKIREFYGDDPSKSDSYARVVNERHWQRLMDLLDDTKGDVVTGGTGDRTSCYLAPTLLRNVAPDATVMKAEIFGPILPVLKVRNMDEAIRFVNARPKPLALYVFTKDGGVAERVLAETSSGGVCVNEVVSHFTVPDLPFGGVGASGMGAYHG